MHGLRPERAEHSYRATHVMATAHAVLLAGLTDDYRPNPMLRLPDAAIDTRVQAVAWLDDHVDELERRVAAALAAPRSSAR